MSLDVLVFGSSGQLAKELYELSQTNSMDMLFLTRTDADLCDPLSCRKAILDIQPKLVINAAAYTNVDSAEDQERVVNLVNAESPIVMANAAKAINVPFVHFSSDYVFGNNDQASIKVHDETKPMNVYGKSKLDGEIGIKKVGGDFFIFRTSWVFSKFGKNFVTTMLELSEKTKTLSIVSDQVGGPTAASDLAILCLDFAKSLQTRSFPSGIYHYCGWPFVSWAEFAKTIFSLANIDMDIIEIDSTDYITKATRPLNSKLDCSLTKSKLGYDQPLWEESLSLVLSHMNSDTG